MPGSAATLETAEPAAASTRGARRPLLRIEGLRVLDRHGRAWVDGVDLMVPSASSIALVGASGSGKSLTAAAVLGILPSGLRATGRVELRDAGDLLTLSERQLDQVRGRRVAWVPQDAGGSLNPILKIGFQIREVLRRHGATRADARQRALELLEEVAMPDPRSRLDAEPRRLSGGQRQRAALAVALAGRPELLIADEPTTALDVTLEAQILDVLERARRRRGASLLLITHDLALVAERCRRLAVMHAGTIVEEGEVRDLLASPQHPATRALVNAARSGAGR
ncbi:MAG: ABC transporter ATP-binding protein [Acidobacteriota bacterium]